MPNHREREHYSGIGAVQSRVIALLRTYSEGNFAANVAERSPLGQRALRIRPPGDTDSVRAAACKQLSLWLADQPWVEAVIARAPHVYLRVRTETMCSWVTAAFSGHGPTLGQEGRDRVAVLQFVDSSAGSPRSLDEFRQAATGRAIASLLASRGYEVMVNPLPVPERAAIALKAAPPEASKVWLYIFSTTDSSSPNDGDLLQAQVGGVDVPHGRLRARHGGTVSAEDILGEIQERLLTEFSNNPALVNSAALREQCAEMLLVFVLLRVERARRVQLDDAKLHGELTAFTSVLEARQFAAAVTSPFEAAGASVPPKLAGSDRAMRDLAVEIDLLPLVAARVVNELEPALITRYVRSLSERAHAARPYLPAADPLWLATNRALDTALSLIAINVPSEVWKPTSPVAKAHWADFPGPENINERKHL